MFTTADLCPLQRLKDGEDFRSLEAETQGDQGQRLHT